MSESTPPPAKPFAFPLVPSFIIAGVATAVALALAPHLSHAPRMAVFDDPRSAPAVTAAPSTRLLGAHPDASVHRLWTTGVKPHFHRAHDETIVVLAGSGTMRLGEESHVVAPGVTILVPRGVVHSLEVSDGAVEAISVFSPPFDGTDRHFLEEDSSPPD